MPTEITVVLQRNLRDALRRRAWKDAGSVLERLKQTDPLSLETRGFELELLLKSGKLTEAEIVATQLTQLFPGSGRTHYLAAQVHYKRKAYAHAERHFRESERIHPHVAVSRYLGKTCVASSTITRSKLCSLQGNRKGTACFLTTQIGKVSNSFCLN